MRSSSIMIINQKLLEESDFKNKDYKEKTMLRKKNNFLKTDNNLIGYK